MTDFKHILLFSQSIAREAGALMINELRKKGGPAAHF